MVTNPSKDELIDLIANESGTCVSVLMRTHMAGRETAQNPIRFKNLIAEAIDKVGGCDEQVRKKLEELAELENDFEFWQHQSAGLALYVCRDFSQRFKLSRSPSEEIVHVADHFYTVPIASALCGGGSTRTLALSWERARLFASDGHEAHEISDDNFPTTMDELVTERDPEVQLQFSTHSTKGGGPAGPGTGSTAMYHGHGEGEDKIEADRIQYLTRVGRMVADEIYSTGHPLIVAATEEVAGQFSSTTDVKVAETISVSPDGVDDREISSRMSEVSRHLLQQSSDELLEKLGTAVASEKGSKELAEVVREAASGRVETLLLCKPQPQYGTFDQSSREVRFDDASDTELVNFAVRETLQAGGTVVDVATQDGCVGAIYRF